MDGASAVGLHRVLEPAGVLPQAAWRLDSSPAICPDETRLRVEWLNLDAASYRQLREAHAGDAEQIRQAVLEIVRTRGKMHNPVTGSGGMLVGIVEEVGPQSPLGLTPGERVATLVSLSLTPLALYDELARWGGASEQIRTDGHAILFARSIAARLPDDLPVSLALAVLDVCGAPAQTARVVSRYAEARVVVIGAAGKSGCLSMAAARRAGAAEVVAVVRDEGEAKLLAETDLANDVVVADARDPVAVARAVGKPADVTVVCVDVAGCEHGAILATNRGGTIVFFSMTTSFTAAALGAEGLAADVTMLIGNGYVPGHAELALDLLRTHEGVQHVFASKLAEGTHR